MFFFYVVFTLWWSMQKLVVYLLVIIKRQSQPQIITASVLYTIYFSKCFYIPIFKARILWVWFHWMFYDHLSAHPLLAKLGQWGWLRMRLSWKKSQKTLDTSKWLHRNNNWSTGSVGKGTWSQLCHYWDCGLGKSAGTLSLKTSSGGVKCPGQVTLTTGS